MQGEVMAFYLARLLGITHTPAVALSKVGGSRRVAMNRSAMANGMQQPSIFLALRGHCVTRIYGLGEVLIKCSYSVPGQYGNRSIGPPGGSRKFE